MNTRRRDDERIERDDRPLSREEANALRRAIERRLGMRLPFKAMLPGKRPPSQAALDRERALDIVKGEIDAAMARCAALEREDPAS